MTFDTKKAEPQRRVKPFQVRLHTSEHREAYERYCRDNDRNLDSQARFLITKLLIDLGYISDIKPKPQKNV